MSNPIPYYSSLSLHLMPHLYFNLFILFASVFHMEQRLLPIRVSTRSNCTAYLCRPAGCIVVEDRPIVLFKIYVNTCSHITQDNVLFTGCLEEHHSAGLRLQTLSCICDFLANAVVPPCLQLQSTVSHSYHQALHSDTIL